MDSIGSLTSIFFCNSLNTTPFFFFCFGSFDFAAGAVETAGAGATAGPVDTAEAGVSAGPGDAIGAEAWLEAAYLRL